MTSGEVQNTLSPKLTNNRISTHTSRSYQTGDGTPVTRQQRLKLAAADGEFATGASLAEGWVEHSSGLYPSQSTSYCHPLPRSRCIWGRGGGRTASLDSLMGFTLETWNVGWMRRDAGSLRRTAAALTIRSISYRGASFWDSVSREPDSVSIEQVPAFCGSSPPSGPAERGVRGPYAPASICTHSGTDGPAQIEHGHGQKQCPSGCCGAGTCG